MGNTYDTSRFVDTLNTTFNNTFTVEDLKVNGTLTVNGYVKDEELTEFKKETVLNLATHTEEIEEFKKQTNDNFTVLSSHMYSIRGYLLDKIEEKNKEIRDELLVIRYKLNAGFVSLVILICLIMYFILR